MSIDWEELLDGSGDELQDAYDALCWEASWDGPPPARGEAEAPQEPVPRLTWEQALDRVNRGLPLRDSHAVNVVQAFGAMPLTDYMGSCMKEYILLRRELSPWLRVRKTTTYQEAADCLFRLCVESERTKESDEHCLDLLNALVCPIYQVIADILSNPF